MGKRTTELIRGAELSERSRMARCQQTKGMGWQSAGSMKNTASLGLIKQGETAERSGGEGGDRQEEPGEESAKERGKESKKASCLIKWELGADV